MRKILSEFYQGELIVSMCLVIFEDIASKLEKIGPNCSSFNPFASLPSVATDDRKQFQCRKNVFNNKTEPLFLELNLCEEIFKILKNISTRKSTIKMQLGRL